MKRSHLLLAAALLAAAGLLVFGDDAPDADLAQPVARQPQRAQASQGAMRPDTKRTGHDVGDGDRDVAIMSLLPRSDLISGAGVRHGRLFASHSWVVAAAPKALPPPPPTAPPLPFAYLGKQISAGQILVYLTQGDRVIVGREHDVIDGIYRIDSIQSSRMTLTYLPLKQPQQLAIGVSE